MRRTIPVLAVILAAQAALAAALALRTDPLAATTPETPLITASLDKVDHLLIEGQPATGASADSARIELASKDGKWVLPDYFGAPADMYKVADLLTDLSSLKRGLPIATSSSALERFKVVDADFVRRLTLRAGDRTVSTLYIGSSSGARRSDARTATDHAVYAVDLPTYELPLEPSNWLDGDILQRDPASVTELDITTPGAHAPLKLVRQMPAAKAASSGKGTASPPAATWAAIDLPADRQVDATHAENLARDVAELHVDAILGTHPQPEWQQDRPLLTLAVSDRKHPGQPSVWTLSAPPVPKPPPAPKAAKGKAAAASAPATPPTPSYYVLKDSGQPWYFKISSYTGKQLLDDSAPDMLVVARSAPGKRAGHAPAL